MKKIKIIFILGTLDIGGTERQFSETVRHLNRSYFDCKVLAFHSQGKLRAELESLDIPFTSLNFSGLPGRFRVESYGQLYTFMKTMVQYLKYEQPDIVQSYLFWPNIYGSLAAKLAGVRVIITGRRNMNNVHSILHYRWLQNFSNLWTTTVLTNSNYVKQECLRLERYVSRQKIQVVYNGVNISQYTGHSRDETPVNTIPHQYSQRPVIGILATLHPRKRHQDFLHAAARVLTKYPQASFWLIGRDTGVYNALVRLVEELNIADSVFFAGEREDIPFLLSQIDVLVSASSREGLSNSILEGMAAAKPIVATRVGGTPELIVHEQTGLLVPPKQPQILAQAILQVLSDNTLAKRLGESARRRVVEMFSMEKMIQNVEAFYQGFI